jgi:hypothetical protein
MTEQLASDVLRFLTERIDSVEHLEALLLLARSPEKWWTAAAVASELGGDTASVSRTLDGLCAQNLLDVRVAQDVLFKFAPRPHDVPHVRALADAYRNKRMIVLQTLSKRVDSVRDFADAFKIGKKKGRDDA